MRRTPRCTCVRDQRTTGVAHNHASDRQQGASRPRPVASARTWVRDASCITRYAAGHGMVLGSMRPSSAPRVGRMRWGKLSRVRRKRSRSNLDHAEHRRDDIRTPDDGAHNKRWQHPNHGSERHGGIKLGSFDHGRSDQHVEHVEHVEHVQCIQWCERIGDDGRRVLGTRRQLCKR